MIIASIVTIPGRLESLIYVLNDLLKQSLQPDLLLVSVSNFYPRSGKYYPVENLQYLKDFLNSYPISNRLITYENDIGPTLKLITPLRELSDERLNKEDTFIFTFDDDTPLYERTIESLLQAYNKNKGAVYSFSGTREERFLHAEFLPHDYDYLHEEFDGLLLSNGPGDPKDCVESIAILQNALNLHKPIFGICLGSQLLALAVGANTYKLKFGHRGQNQPCQDLHDLRCYLTSQNHGYAICDQSLPSDWEVSFQHLHDKSIAGIRHKNLPYSAVQFHPEAAAGPHDTAFLFAQFIELVIQKAGK